MRAGPGIGALALALVAGSAAAAEAGPGRHLDAIHLGAAYHEHYSDGVETFAGGPTLTLEVGALVSREIGVTGLLRGQRYTEDIPIFDASVQRTEVLAGARVYFQPRPEVLGAVGAGLIFTRQRIVDFPGELATQKFVEVYLGWAVLRSRCTDLEIGAHAGYSPDERYIWLGLAIAARRRMW